MSCSPISSTPSNPFHISRAYGVQAPSAANATARSASSEQTDPIGSIKPATPSSRLAAAVVPGRVQFNGSAATDTSAALPFYRHPADKNAAATLLTAGRMLDVNG